MEVHRLKNIELGEYDKDLFKELYDNTEKLRNKLAYGIDPNRLGADQEEIKSWFDCKFIYAFAKYQSKEPDMLKAYIINSLSNFKYRILRKGYSKQNEAMMNKVDITEFYNHGAIVDVSPQVDDRIHTVMDFMKKNLSQEAYDILLIDMYPPAYIVEKLRENTDKEDKKLPRVNRALVAEFYGKSEADIEKLQREIRKVKKLARVSLT